jgi:hypothetical protein
VAPLDNDALAAAVAEALREDLPPVEKGRALERYAQISLGAIPGITVECFGTDDVFRAQEIDILCSNDQDRDGLPHFEHFILVECKNWAAPVGSDEVNWFHEKLRARALGVGVLFAMNGITGEGELFRAANLALAEALREGRHILVVRREEIEEVATGEELAMLLKRKQVELVARRGLRQQ